MHNYIFQDLYVWAGQTISFYDSRTMHSHNMYQIFTYVLMWVIDWLPFYNKQDNILWVIDNNIAAQDFFHIHPL